MLEVLTARRMLIDMVEVLQAEDVEFRLSALLFCIPNPHPEELGNHTDSQFGPHCLLERLA